MTRTHPILLGSAAVLALVTACSSSGGTSSAAATSSAPAAASVAVSLKSGHLTGPDGKTLYINSVDTQTHLICTGSCLSIWPPVTGKPVAGSGVDASTLGTIARGSSTQATFEGHPLYEFKSDKAPGDTNGTGLTDQGGTWRPAGAAAPKDVSSSAPSSSSGGYGYP